MKRTDHIGSGRMVDSSARPGRALMSVSPSTTAVDGGDAASQSRARLQALLVESLPIMERATRLVAQGYRLSAAQTEDLASEARVALIANDYQALACFEGRSSLKIYLVTLAAGGYPAWTSARLEVMDALRRG